MLGLAELAIEKIEAAPNLSAEKKEEQTYIFNLKVAEALFAAGDIQAARMKMEDLATEPPQKLKAEVDRLRTFLTITKQGPQPAAGPPDRRGS